MPVISLSITAALPLALRGFAGHHETAMAAPYHEGRQTVSSLPSVDDGFEQHG
jgi:hypothetical protein